MDVADAHRLKQLEAENAKLKKMLAEEFLVHEGVSGFAKENAAPVVGARLRLSHLAGPVVSQLIRGDNQGRCDL